MRNQLTETKEWAPAATRPSGLSSRFPSTRDIAQGFGESRAISAITRKTRPVAPLSDATFDKMLVARAPIEHLQTEADTILAPALIINSDLKISYCNQGMLGMLNDAGLDATNPTSQSLMEGLPWMPGGAVRQLREVLATGTASVKCHECRRDNTWVLLELEMKPLASSGNGPSVLLNIKGATGLPKRLGSMNLTVETLKDSNVAYAMLDMQGRMTYANLDFQRLFRVEPTEIADHVDFKQFWNGTTSFDKVVAIVETIGAWSEELVLSRDDNTACPVHLTISALRDEQGRPMVLTAMAVDLSLRLQRDVTLAQCQTTIQALLNVDRGSAVLLETNGTVIASSRDTGLLFDLPITVLQGQMLMSQLPRDAAELFKTHLDFVVRNQSSVTWDCFEGGRSIRNTLYPIIEGKESLDKVLLSCHDISEHKSIEKALSDSNFIMSAIAEAVPSAVVTFDALGRITTWNTFAENVFGWVGAYGIGDRLSDLVHTEDHEFDKSIERTLNGESIIEFETSHLRADGGQTSLLISLTPILDAGGAVVGGVATASQNQSDAPDNALPLLLEAANTNAQGVDDVAHGLANLLQSIISMSENLSLQSVDPERIATFVDYVNHQVSRGVALVEKLTDLSGTNGRQKSSADFDDQITELTPILPSSIATDVSLETQLCREGFTTGNASPATDANKPDLSDDLSLGQGERVLIVEDEEGARQGLSDMLEVLGYTVTAVGSGEEANQLPDSSHFDVLLTDFRLPDTNGIELARDLRDRWLGLHTILMSSYSEEQLRRQSTLGEAFRFMQKPFNMSALASELRATLDSPATLFAA